MRNVRATLLLLVPGTVYASNVTEFPDVGSEQMGRGGAWVARASDPLATFFNPAGLAGQDTRATLQGNLIFHKTCFARVRSSADASNEPSAGIAGQFPEVCNDAQINPNPQIAFAYRIHERVGIGVAVLGPNAAGSQTWPEFVTVNNIAVASPQRYLLLNQQVLLLHPSVGVGWEVMDNLRIGASVQWGVASMIVKTSTLALNGNDYGPESNDVKATLQAKDMFVPGFTLGSLWSANEYVDLAGWYRWSAPIEARGDLGTAASYFRPQVAAGSETGIRYGDTIYSDCGTGTNIDTCKDGDNARLTFVIPMEAKIGVRFHVPRENANPRVRDPLRNDVFDAEMDVTWANNSAADTVRVRFPGNATQDGILPVSGTPGFVPPNADVKKGFKDVFGVRVGGDYNVLPDRLALRTGAFFETEGQDARYQHIDFAGGARFGLSLGATFRWRLSESARSALEFSAGYGHVFVADMKNADRDASGLPALAGTNCNPAESPAPAGDLCATGRQKYRSNWPVNLGTVTNTINVINLGVAYRF